MKELGGVHLDSFNVELKEPQPSCTSESERGAETPLCAPVNSFFNFNDPELRPEGPETC